MCGINQTSRLHYIRSLTETIALKRERLENLRRNIDGEEERHHRAGTDVQADVSYRMMVSQRDYLVDSLKDDYAIMRTHAAALE